MFAAFLYWLQQTFDACPKWVWWYSPLSKFVNRHAKVIFLKFFSKAYIYKWFSALYSKRLSSKLLFRQRNNSFISSPHIFPRKRFTVTLVLGRLEIRHGFPQCLILLLAPQQDGTKKSRRYNYAICPWSTLVLLPEGVASRACLANIFWGFLVTWMDHRSCDLSIQRNG